MENSEDPGEESCPRRKRPREWPTVMSDSKILNDAVHGHIEIPSLCIKIMDTPQFQRLRNIKQLGTAYFVFPGACHNRFEHSVGVCYLAGKLIKNIQIRQPELHITDKDVLCVQIAGLCHDLGHGPFSHLFEHFFIHKIDTKPPWTHELASIMMFDHLVEVNELLPVFRSAGLEEQDMKFIKELIYGPLPEEGSDGKPESPSPSPSSSAQTEDVTIDGRANLWQFRGRPESKRYLYEIVANKRNGIDVDKFDYFSRDCHHLNIKNNFDHVRWIKFARVIKVDGELQICTRDKEVSNLYDLFSTRFSLHRRAYQHKVVDLITCMIGEMLVKANEFLLFKGPNGKLLKMSEAIWHPEVYTRLTDSVFERILWSTEEELAPARQIAMDIQRRKLYRFIGQTYDAQSLVDSKNVKKSMEELTKYFNLAKSPSLPEFSSSDFIVNIIVIDYGKKSKNPVDFVRFYSKSNPDQARQVKKELVSRMLPETFSERWIRVFLKRRGEADVEAAKKGFANWSKARGLPPPINSGDTLGIDLNEEELVEA